MDEAERIAGKLTKAMRLIRAWACYWAMQGIDAASAPIPRSPTKARIINALTRPFFRYGAYWALRSNPNAGKQVKDLENTDAR